MLARNDGEFMGDETAELPEKDRYWYWPLIISGFYCLSLALIVYSTELPYLTTPGAIESVSLNITLILSGLTIRLLFSAICCLPALRMYLRKNRLTTKTLLATFSSIALMGMFAGLLPTEHCLKYNCTIDLFFGTETCGGEKTYNQDFCFDVGKYVRKTCEAQKLDKSHGPYCFLKSTCEDPNIDTSWMPYCNDGNDICRDSTHATWPFCVEWLKKSGK